jgi:hypothetical protein
MLATIAWSRRSDGSNGLGQLSTINETLERRLKAGRMRPHEIANVLGADGLSYFLQSALGTVMDLRVQLSSCVPATALETSGARLTASDLVAHRGIRR